MLQCSMCKKRKDESEFWKNKSRKTWYYPNCKQCANSYKYGRRSSNKDKVKEYNRKDNIRNWFRPESRLKYIWQAMKRRCNNPEAYGYQRYGARWIKVERKSFKDFYKDMAPWYIAHVTEYGYWRKNVQIDRIDNDWNYCKENCRWVTAKENNPHNHEKEFNSN